LGLVSGVKSIPDTAFAITRDRKSKACRAEPTLAEIGLQCSDFRQYGWLFGQKAVDRILRHESFYEEGASEAMDK